MEVFDFFFPSLLFGNLELAPAGVFPKKVFKLYITTKMHIYIYSYSSNIIYVYFVNTCMKNSMYTRMCIYSLRSTFI